MFFIQSSLNDMNRSAMVNKLRWELLYVQGVMVFMAFVIFNEISGLFIILPLFLCYLLTNVVHTGFVKKQKIQKWHIPFFLTFDLLQWSFILAVMGGVYNPLVFFLVIPVVISSIYASERVFFRLLLCMIISVTIQFLITFKYEPNWHFREIIVWYINQYSTTHHEIDIIKDWLAIIVTGSFVSISLFVMRNDAVKYSRAQSASSKVYQEYTRAAAIGTMAAAAVHELGTPLNTIHLISTELAEEIKEDFTYHTDFKILAEQTTRCQNILKNLAKINYSEDNQKIDALGVSMLMEQIAYPYEKEDIEFKVRLNNNPENNKVRIAWINEWTYAIGNILQNAFQFAKTRVTISIELRKGRLIISVMDDGKGYSKEILETVGEPYISGRVADKKGNHMGLGLFIAKSLIEQTGGTIDFSNNQSGGARVTIVCRFE